MSTLKVMVCIFKQHPFSFSITIITIIQINWFNSKTQNQES